MALARTGYQMEKGEILANQIPNNPDPDWDQTTTNIKDANPELIDPCDDFDDGKCPTVSRERAFACGCTSLDSWRRSFRVCLQRAAATNVCREVFERLSESSNLT